MFYKTITRLILLLFLVLLSVPTPAEMKFKIRAREHFDTVWLSKTDIPLKKTYSGIGPNLNFWMEDPYHLSFGLSYSFMFIGNGLESDISGIGEDMDLTKIGLEAKYYFIPGNGGPFTRLGISRNTLNTKGSFGLLNGTGYYLGIGWEIPFSQLGLAFEAATRRITFPEAIRIETFSPSIGVHFYGYL